MFLGEEEGERQEMSKGAVIIIKGRHDATNHRGDDATGMGRDLADRSNNAGGHPDARHGVDSGPRAR